MNNECMPSKRRYKIAVVDDQRLFRKGIISLIEEHEDLRVSIESENGKELISSLNKQGANLELDLVLLDLEMPVMDGIKTADYLHKHYPALKILILSMHDDEEFILHLINKGVRGFLLKDASTKTFIEAIYSIIDNEYYFNDRVNRIMLKGLINEKKIKPKFNTANLSDREQEIVQLICKEYTNKEISDMLALALRTVDNHRESILQKTGARNTAGIVMYAIKNHLLD